MNFQQLKTLREVIKNDLSLTEAANSLYASQSGVSKQIKELELELGVEIFVRNGKRITGLTEVGKGIYDIAAKILLEAENLKTYSQHFINTEAGRLRIATTHNQARHVLPEILKSFTNLYPGVELDIKQVTPKEAASLLAHNEVDIAIATEALDDNIDIIRFPCFNWHHIVIVPKGHPLEKSGIGNIKDLAKYPIVTYSPEFSGRSRIDKAFAQAGIAPDIRFTTMDSDVIKTYVEVGLGIGIISEIAKSDIDDKRLSVIDEARYLFSHSTTKLALRPGALIQKFTLDFAALMVPGLSESKIKFSTKIAAELEKFQALIAAGPNLPDFIKWRDFYIGRIADEKSPPLRLYSGR